MPDKTMNTGLLAMPPRSRLPGNDLPVLTVHERIAGAAPFTAAFPEK